MSSDAWARLAKDLAEDFEDLEYLLDDYLDCGISEPVPPELEEEPTPYAVRAVVAYIGRLSNFEKQHRLEALLHLAVLEAIAADDDPEPVMAAEAAKTARLSFERYYA